MPPLQRRPTAVPAVHSLLIPPPTHPATTATAPLPRSNTVQVGEECTKP